MNKQFLQYLLLKPHQYVLVWCHFFANTDTNGVFEDNYQFVLSKFDLSRSSLQRVVDYGCAFDESGQDLGRIWAGKKLKITISTKFSGQDLGRNWAENNQDLFGQTTKEKKEKKSPKKKNVSDSEYKKMVQVYNDFCIVRSGLGAKMDGLQGKSMKQIMAFLRTQVKNKQPHLAEEEIENEVVNAWSFILKQWPQVDKFYASQIKVNQIYSNLPNIVASLKNQSKTQRNERFTSTFDAIDTISFKKA